mgnify:CR=1 FL=1
MWLVFFLTIFPFVFLGFIPGAGWTYVLIFLAANAAWIIIAYLLIPPYFRSITYELGEQEIIVRKGIITKTEKLVPYRMVTNVSVKRGPLDRWFGLGGLEVHTAGYSQQTGPEARLSGLEDYEGVHQELMASLRNYRQEASPSVSAETGEGMAPEESVSCLLQQILEEIKALRAEKH